MNFEQAFEILLGHEGGISDHRADNGGLTKYGISKKAYPQEDIRALTVERAKEIYLRDYWGPAGCDAVPDQVKFDLFDMAVNSGVKSAIRTLQRSVDTTPDGVLGPRTLQAIQSMPVPRLLARFNGFRLELLTDLADWPSFGRGWAKRIAKNLKLV